MSFFIRNFISFYCDHCGYHEDKIIGKVVDARKDGWAISKDYKKCYCPKCAPMFRNVGHAYGGYRPWVNRQ